MIEDTAKIIEERSRIQARLLNGRDICYNKSGNRAVPDLNLDDLNMDGLKPASMRKYTSNVLMEKIYCLFNTTLYMSDNSLPKASEFVKRTFHNLYQYRRGYTSKNDLFQIKSAESPNESDEFLHEFFVTSFMLNRLRAYIPNFAYCFGGFKLEAPSTTADGLTCACNTDKIVDYLIFEKLDGITMTSALSRCSIEDVLSWICQIVLSLDLAGKQYSFTHYNLHTDNIIVRDIQNENDWAYKSWIRQPTKYAIKYFYNNQVVYVTSATIATMVNFELSHVEYNRTHMGDPNYSNIGIYWYEHRPFYDLYKIIMTMLSALSKTNIKVFNNAVLIAGFFGFQHRSDLLKALETEKESLYVYSVNVTDLERTRTLGNFISYLQEKYPGHMPFILTMDGYGNQVLNMEEDGKFKLNDFQHYTNSLTYFGNIHDIMTRYIGLQKRSDVFSDKIPGTEEAEEARREFVVYHDLIQNNAEALREKERDRIIELNRRIKLFKLRSIEIINQDVLSAKSRADYAKSDIDEIYRITDSIKEFDRIFMRQRPDLEPIIRLDDDIFTPDQLKLLN